MGDLGEKECDLSPHVGSENCLTRKFLTEHMGAPLCLSDEGEFKPLRPGWGPKREESGLQKQVTLSAYFPQSVSIFTSSYQVHTPEPTYAP